MRTRLKDGIRRVIVFVVLAVLCVTMFLGGQFTAPVVHAASNRDLEFDKTNVMEDLTGATVNGKPFNLLNYPFDSTGVVKHPEIMNVVEYCYSFQVNARGNYGLYLYFYNPACEDIVTASGVNQIQIATDFYYKGENGKEGEPQSYSDFPLQSDWDKSLEFQSGFRSGAAGPSHASAKVSPIETLRRKWVV